MSAIYFEMGDGTVYVAPNPYMIKKQDGRWAILPRQNLTLNMKLARRVIIETEDGVEIIKNGYTDETGNMSIQEFIWLKLKSETLK